MNKKVLSIFFFSIILTVSTFANQNLGYTIKTIDGKKYYEYQVQKSEGFYSITKKFGVTEDEIKSVNPDTENGLTLNSVILIPVKEQNYTLHKVDKKETMYSLSKKYNVSYEDLYALNPDLQKEGLKYGTEVKIPEKKTVTVQSLSVSDTMKVVQKESKPSFAIHTVQKGETLYSISKLYGITSEEIIRLNPDVKDGVKLGKKLIIPPVYNNTALTSNSKENKQKNFIYHVVKKKETLYSISKQYSVSQDEILRLNANAAEGLNEGSVLIIPPAYGNTRISNDSISNDPLVNMSDSLVAANDSILNLQNLFVRSTTPKSEINLAIALPFQLSKVTGTSKIDGNTNKFLEFYQGVLIAVDSLKRSGLSYNIYVYDSGKSEAEIKKMLDNPELKDMDILIGPAYTTQIKPMSEYALQNNIKLIIPFSSKSEETQVNPNIFQINTPQDQLNYLMADLFIKQFSNKNIVIWKFKNAAYDDKKLFGDTLASMMTQRGIPFHTVFFDNMSSIKSVLSTDKENIVIPLTANQVALNQSLPMINMLASEKRIISLFGFSEWQSYQSISKDIFVLNTYFATPFYIDFTSPEVLSYLKNFRKFFNAEPINSQPQYGMLGYDIVMFFSNAISHYGHDFEISLDSVKQNSLQSNLHFSRLPNNGGFYNSSIYLTNHNDVTGLTAINGITLEKYPVKRANAQDDKKVVKSE